MPKSIESKFPIVERKGENETKIEKLFKMFINRTSREGLHEGRRWLNWMYTYLTENERKTMKNRIKKFKEMEGTGVQKEKRLKAKEELLKSLENFSKERDNDFKKMYSEKTPLERKKTLMESHSSLEMVEEAFKRWKERENKFKEASTEEWFKMSLEEMDPEEIGRWKKRIGRKMEGNENIEQMRPFAEAILKCEREKEEKDKKFANMSQGEKEAEKEEEKLGEPVVFLGDVEAGTKGVLKSWLTKGLNKEEVQEDVEGLRANVRYAKRIIRELEKEERREKR